MRKPSPAGEDHPRPATSSTHPPPPPRGSGASETGKRPTRGHRGTHHASTSTGRRRNRDGGDREHGADHPGRTERPGPGRRSLPSPTAPRWRGSRRCCPRAAEPPSTRTRRGTRPWRTRRSSWRRDTTRSQRPARSPSRSPRTRPPRWRRPRSCRRDGSACCASGTALGA